VNTRESAPLWLKAMIVASSIALVLITWTMTGCSTATDRVNAGGACSTAPDEDNGRIWIPKNSGCGPGLNEIAYIILRDGRRCDYQHADDAPAGDFTGLWCDVVPGKAP
jgi:hypothetical protein